MLDDTDLKFKWKPRRHTTTIKYVQNIYQDEEATQKDDQFSNNSSVKNEVPDQNSLISMNDDNDDIKLHIEENHFQNKILIVDDQDFNIKAAQTILEYKLKMDTEKVSVCATSGQKALDIIKEDAKANKYLKSSFSLILMDYEMPEMDGLETTNLIREFLYKENIDQPVIASITGHSEKIYIDRAIEAGINIVF